MARKSRVPPIPELTTSTEYVAVRHVNLGTKSRLFRSSSHFSVVYDWIGSLSNTPEFYEIKDHKGVTAQPDAKIITGAYNMVCSDSPPLLVSDGEISFQGFGNSKESLDEPYFDLQGLRVGEKEKYIREQISVIKRDDIYESMINLYKKRNVKNSKISLRFEGEDAVGDGVTRDAFSAFIRSVYNLSLIHI